MKPAFRPTSLLGGSSAGRVAVRTLAFASFMAFASISLQWYSPYIRPYTLSILGLVAALAGTDADGFREITSLISPAPSTLTASTEKL